MRSCLWLRCLYFFSCSHQSLTDRIFSVSGDRLNFIANYIYIYIYIPRYMYIYIERERDFAVCSCEWLQMFGSAKIYTDKSHIYIYMELLTERYIYIQYYMQTWNLPAVVCLFRHGWRSQLRQICLSHWCRNDTAMQMIFLCRYILYIHMYIAGFTWTCTSRRCQLSALIWTGNRIICLFLFHIYIHTVDIYIYKTYKSFLHIWRSRICT